VVLCVVTETVPNVLTMAVSNGDVVVVALADVCCVIVEDENEGAEDRVLLLVVLLPLDVLLLVIPFCDNVICTADEALRGLDIEASMVVSSMVGDFVEVGIEGDPKTNAELLVVVALVVTFIVGAVKDVT